jgi:hypothetical protein
VQEQRGRLDSLLEGAMDRSLQILEEELAVSHGGQRTNRAGGCPGG